jgi:4-amino-4-deoxy-L-arabinose transferase-like glycosyltransferase
MEWLLTWDVELFRFINLRLINPVFDWVMPLASGNAFFVPALVLVLLGLLWRGGKRGALCVLMLAGVLAVGDGLICRTIKAAVGRPRPFLAMADVRCLVGQTHSASFPSSHAANWFAAAMVAWIYYRRSWRWMLPIAALVGFSRMYNGVHYPSDVLAGAILGAGYAAATVWLLDGVWAWAGRKWFPLWWEQAPSLIAQGSKSEAAAEEEAPLPRRPGRSSAAGQISAPLVDVDQHWIRLGYMFLGVLLVLRLVYIAGHTIELSEDEAYQWLWSKHLAMSYYSKPPLIAYTQWLGTWLWGDTAFGVRFFSPIISAVMGFLLFRFIARLLNGRASFFLLLILAAAPLVAVGGVLMTVDPLSVLFWTAAMLAGWQASQAEGKTADWLWVGLWSGLGFLSKYTELLQLLCWVVFFILWRPARRHLRRPGPYLGLLVNLACAAPVLLWNSQNGWITVTHVAQGAGAGTHWHPTLRYLGEFVGSEAGLLNPVFFVAAIWAAVAMWKRNRHDPRLVYFFCMGWPLVLVYLLQSLRHRVLPNWIAPAVAPMMCLMVAYWDIRWRLGVGSLGGWQAVGERLGWDAETLVDRVVSLRKRTLAVGLGLGFALVILGHNTDLIGRLTGGHLLPVNDDPLHRVRQWRETARVIGEVRKELLAEGKPVFIIAEHYGMVGQTSFYLPEAREAVTGTPLVYYQASPVPRNQFYFWPGYQSLKGQNAVYVWELDRDDPKSMPAPDLLREEFDSVTDLGVRDVLYHGRLLRPLQFFACRGLR